MLIKDWAGKMVNCVSDALAWAANAVITVIGYVIYGCKKLVGWIRANFT